MRRDDDPLHNPRALAAAAATGAVGLVAWKQLMKRSRPRRPRMTEWPDADYLPTVSIGPDSLIPQDTLDFEASRFLAGTESGLRGGSDPRLRRRQVGGDGRGSAPSWRCASWTGSAPSSARGSSSSRPPCAAT